MCEYCKPIWSSKTQTAICKDLKVKETACGETAVRSCNIYLDKEDTPSLLIWDYAMRAVYVDIAYCPYCGRKLEGIDETN